MKQQMPVNLPDCRLTKLEAWKVILQIFQQPFGYNHQNTTGICILISRMQARHNISYTAYYAMRDLLWLHKPRSPQHYGYWWTRTSRGNNARVRLLKKIVKIETAMSKTGRGRKK